MAGLPGGSGGGELVRVNGIPRRRAWWGASGPQHHCSRADKPERRIHPAGGRVGLGLPDESGVPAVVSGCALARRASDKVARVFNLPYRRFAIGRPLDAGCRAEPARALQNAILRYFGNSRALARGFGNFSIATIESKEQNELTAMKACVQFR